MLAVPVGSTEQHGPHLPLSTDTDIAVALAGRLAARRSDVIVTPPLSYGSSGEHAHFAGTISIGQEALELTLVELGRSAAGTFRHILLISAHGGNDEPVTRATRHLRAEARDVVAWLPGARPSLIPPEVLGRARAAGHPASADAHAGRTETSIQLALGPGRVRLDLAEAGNRAPLGELMPLLRSSGVRAASPNGVLGDPAGASAAEGAGLLAALEADLVAAVSAWLGGQKRARPGARSTGPAGCHPVNHPHGPPPHVRNDPPPDVRRGR